MNTIRKNTGIMLLFTLLLVSSEPAVAGETATLGYEWMHGPNSTVLLKPGWVTSCQKDFIVENLADTEATVRIDLGIERYHTDSLGTNEKRLYSLRESLSFAKQLGKTVNMDDVAQVQNASPDAPIRVHC